MFLAFAQKAYYNRNKATHTMEMSFLERNKKLRSTRRNQKHALAFDHSLHPFKEVQEHSQHSIGDLMQRRSQQIGIVLQPSQRICKLNLQKQWQRLKLTPMTSTTTIATRTTWATGGTRARTCDKSDNQEEAVSSTSSNNNNSISKCPNFNAMKER